MTDKNSITVRRRHGMFGVAIIAGCALAGCAANGGGSAMTTGSTAGAMECKSMQESLDRLYRGGIAAKTAAANAGKPLSAKDRADVNQYNELLTRYVKKKCHK